MVLSFICATKPLAFPLTLSATYPMDSEIDNVTNYVSTVPLKELGLGLGEEPLSDEQVQELTDDYSLPALKVGLAHLLPLTCHCDRNVRSLTVANQEPYICLCVSVTPAGLFLLRFHSSALHPPILMSPSIIF